MIYLIFTFELFLLIKKKHFKLLVMNWKIKKNTLISTVVGFA